MDGTGVGATMTGGIGGGVMGGGRAWMVVAGGAGAEAGADGADGGITVLESSSAESFGFRYWYPFCFAFIIL